MKIRLIRITRDKIRSRKLKIKDQSAKLFVGGRGSVWRVSRLLSFLLMLRCQNYTTYYLSGRTAPLGYTLCVPKLAPIQNLNPITPIQHLFSNYFQHFIHFSFQCFHFPQISLQMSSCNTVEILRVYDSLG